MMTILCDSDTMVWNELLRLEVRINANLCTKNVNIITAKLFQCPVMWIQAHLLVPD